jgi:catechol-2,3-dioxygenase
MSDLVDVLSPVQSLLDLVPAPGSWHNMIPVTRLNHAVLFVRDLDRAVDFYHRVFGFEVIFSSPSQAAFLRAQGSANHHDLGLFATASSAPRPLRGAPGLYHLAWEVPTIEDLAAARTTLAQHGALQGQSDHGATKSLYGSDPEAMSLN